MTGMIAFSSKTEAGTVSRACTRLSKRTTKTTTKI